MKVSQSLSQILAKSVSLISVLRHERNSVNIQFAFGKNENLQRRILAVLSTSKLCTELLPGTCRNINCSLSQSLGRLTPALRLNQCHAYFLGITLHVTEEGREIIFLSSLKGNTVETIVLHTYTRPAVIVIIMPYALNVHAHVGGIIGVQGMVHTRFYAT